MTHKSRLLPRTTGRVLVTALVATGLVLGTSTPGAWALTVGQAPPPDDIFCASQAVWAQTSVASGTPSVVPVSGTVSSVTSRMYAVGQDSYRLVVLRPTGPNYTVVAVGNPILVPHSPPPAPVTTAITPVAVRAGDLLGFFLDGSTNRCLDSTGNAGDAASYFGFLVGPPGVGNVLSVQQSLRAVLSFSANIDQTAPTIAITTPANGASYELGQNVLADFSCVDEQFGSATQSCVGTVADGAPIDTSTLGPHTFNVAATDRAGNNATASSSYTVVPPSNRTLPAVVRGSTNWILGQELVDTPPTTTFSYGARPLAPMMGDWNGDGVDTPGTFERGEFKLRNSNTAGDPDIKFFFGDPRGYPVAGDFNGDGTDDIAVYRDGTWQVRLSTGEALAPFTFGTGNWPATVPVAGDWDGDGTDGIGTFTYEFATWRLVNTASAGPLVRLPFVFGSPNASYPVVGDWDNDGDDNIGVKLTAGTTWSLRYILQGGPPDKTIQFGQPNDLPLSWEGP